MEKGLTVTKVYRFTNQTKQKIPLFTVGISAGFPSPADDFIEKKLDLNEHLIKHPAATFFVRISGDSMQNAGIHSGDILVVDRAEKPSDGKIVVALLNGEFVVKRIKKQQNKIFLLPENSKYKPLEVTKEMDFEVWGVVLYVIHQPK
ncbi:MAG: translesion error-prone DNA polymerase V autoproteolytic subunit [Candidatus Margulisbacteria bacterium]|nr:translesion error-prone DNA polymerase V autoproteolytic subunit [Candidatus Margulisiibacteriota bacterium]